MLVDVLLVFNEFIVNNLLHMSLFVLKARDAIKHIICQAEAIYLIQHYHIKWRSGRSLFLIAANMKIVVVRAAVGEAVN